MLQVLGVGCLYVVQRNDACVAPCITALPTLRALFSCTYRLVPVVLVPVRYRVTYPDFTIQYNIKKTYKASYVTKKLFVGAGVTCD